MGAYTLFRAGNTLFHSEQHLSDDVCKNGRAKWANGTFHKFALFAVGNQAFLESVCGHNKDKTLVDNRHADYNVGGIRATDTLHASPRAGVDSIGADTNQPAHNHAVAVCHHGICIGNT